MFSVPHFAAARVLIIFFFLFAYASAQELRNSESAVDNRTRTDVRVDPISHALQLQIPLAEYPGRAGTNLPVTLYYSSKVWNVTYVNSSQCVDDQGHLYRAEYAKRSAAGWTSNLDGVTTPSGISLELYDGYTTKPKNSSSFLRKVARMFIILPDGSRHELRKDDDFHEYNENVAGLYYAVDGTRLVFDTTTNTLYLPDGSYYVLTTSGQTYTDRNGNQLTYNNASRQWTDTMGRTIGSPLLTSGVGDVVGVNDQDFVYTIPTVGGGLSTYTFRWKHLSTAGVINEQDPVQTLRYKGDRLTACQSGTDYSGLFHSAEADYNGIQKSNLFDPVVLQQITLPNGQSYTFKYNIYGEITKVIYPTGGYDRFTFGQAPSISAEDTIGLYSQANRGVVNRWLSPNGTQSGELLPWTYTGFNTYAPDGSHVDRSVFTTTADWAAYGFEDPRLGMVYDERAIAQNGQMLRRKLTDYAVDGQITAHSSYLAYRQRNVRPIKEVEILLDTGNGNPLAAVTTYQYDQDLNVIATNHYDYAAVTNQTVAQTGGISSMPLGTLLRTEETTFLVNDPTIDYGVRSSYRSRNLVALASSKRIKDGSGNIVAQSYLSYDESDYPLMSYGSVTGWSNPGTTYRGNPTTQGAWLNTTGTYIKTHSQYDQCGSVRKVWDAQGNLSQINYSDAFSDYARNTYAYPTVTTTAIPDSSGSFGSITPLSSSRVYDFNTGLLISTTDPNAQTTTYSYDSMRRMTQASLPDGGRTTKTYVDSHQCGAYVETKTLLDSSGRETDAWQFFDGLGRVNQTDVLDDQDVNNRYIRVDTQYDLMGRAFKVSNPYRTSGCTAAINPTDRWTQTAFDSLGRVLTLSTPDGAVATITYLGSSMTVTDQAGKSRKNVADALGRLTQVYEDPSGLSYLTAYTYDVLDNLRRVDQDSQQRFFMYDSLSRLIRAKNPEHSANSNLAITDSITGNSQWSMGYGYDNNGNLTTRVDARNVTTTYAYDALNRNTTVRYTDGTKDIDRHYDNPTANKNGLGRLWYLNWDPNNNTRFDTHVAIDQYDPMGRALNYRQHFFTNGVASPQFNVTRTYDKAGDVLTQSYPSGRTVNYGYDIAARLNSYTGNLGDGVSRTYASGFSYTEFGALQQERFDTQIPLYHKLHYNVRGQLYDVRLSTFSLAANEFDWNRGCLALYYGGYAWGQSGPLNNGNLTRQEHYAPADETLSNYSYTQDIYNYDSLNRLGSISELHGGPWSQSGQDFAQVYNYDRFGNRTIDQNQTTPSIPHPNYTADTSNNRLIAPAGYNYGYDNAGNQTNDTYTGQGARTYDAENRMKQAWANNQWQTYTYDADGRRIKRNVNGVETWQVYGMDGELLAEYASGAAPFVATTEYGYRGGELLITITNGDTQRLARFVTNLYYGALQRDPTSAELNDKMAQLATAGAQGQSQLLTTANQIARSLFTATNYETSPYRSDLQYVADLYYAYLQRGPDDGGLNWWAGQVPGSGRTNVCNAFEASAEFQTLVANLYGSATSDNERTEHFVNSFYRGAYGRDATSTEIQQQRDALNAAAAQSQSAVQAQAESFGRSLFTGQVNDTNLSNGQFVTNLYEAFLQRGPDSGGLGWWSGQATVGTGRQNVLNAFATCGAFRDLSGALYREANWLVSDRLGTPRMIANKSGTLAAMKRHDYLPFGEELFAGTAGRTTAQGYTGDNVRQKFTKYERDSETSLDFAEARGYASAQGRFTRPDPFNILFEMKSGRDAREQTRMLQSYLSEPQNWNRYGYCVNDPLNLVDPSGLVWLTKDNRNYIWVPDDEYDKNKDQYQDYSVADGAVIQFTGSSDCDKCNGLKKGDWVQLKSDGTIDTVPDPTVYIFPETYDSYSLSYKVAQLGMIVDSNSQVYPTFGGGMSNFNYGYSQTSGDGPVEPGIYLQASVSGTGITISESLNILHPSQGFSREVGYGLPNVGVGVQVIMPALQGTTPHDWAHHPDNPQGKGLAWHPVGRSPY